MAISQRYQIAHLLRRAGFGATVAELDQYNKLGFEGAVDRLLDFGSVPDPAEEGATRQGFDLAKSDGIRQWWLYRMFRTTRPLQEKLTLFWHGHFAVSNAKVNNPVWMRAQNELFRRNAAGSFRDLVQAVAKNPAMLRWLDSATNRKRAPNENFARELMELFCLGIGNYTEADVKEAARAFTGWEIRGDSFYFNPNEHDDGDKTVLGRTGNLGGEAVIDHVVARPAAARFLAGKLFRFFVYDDPEPAVIDRLARVYTASGYSIKAVMREILLAPEFRSDRAYRAKIKSPIELTIGALKDTGVYAIPRNLNLASWTRSMGQDLFYPPTVKGWDGGRTWLTAATLVTRCNFLSRLLSGSENNQRYVKPDVLLGEAGISGDDTLGVINLFAERFVEADAKPALATDLEAFVGEALANRALRDRSTRAIMHLIMASPSYQAA
ncbi:MAG: DUF1800 domain-containing protein [Chloroflexi bacterium]|nr:DUF1800 domain-containing protein [Chloroflexota bacterium]